MDKSISILIVICSYNHGASVRVVAEQALKVHDRVLVVDDGSTDGTMDRLKGLNVLIERHEQNRGKGAAILTGARRARLLGMTHIVTIDADGQHDPADFLRFVPLIHENPVAIIVGTRLFLRGTPLLSKFGRQFSNFWLRVQTGRSVRDCQSGFRAYPVSVLEQLRLRERGYAFEVEVLVKAAWAGVGLRNLDISVSYPPESERVSHFHLVRDNARLSLLNTKLTIRAILPLPHRRIMPVSGSKGEISLMHPVRSLRLLLEENILPGPLAAATALGVLLGALPLIACHTIVILFAASFLRLNKVTAVCASQICMPPLVPALCIETGYFVRHKNFLTEVSLNTLGYQCLERVYEWAIGSLILGPALAAVTGGFVYAVALFVEQGISGRK